MHLDLLLLESDKVASVEQRRQLYSHPLISTRLIESHHQRPKEIVRAVREHLECLDGSDYPSNLMGDAINPPGKILSLAKVVVGIFASGKVAPEMRLSILLQMNTHRYDNTISLLVIVLPQPEAAVAGQTLLDDPVKRLLAIDDALQHWPADLPPPEHPDYPDDSGAAS